MRAAHQLSISNTRHWALGTRIARLQHRGRHPLHASPLVLFSAAELLQPRFWPFPFLFPDLAQYLAGCFVLSQPRACQPPSGSPPAVNLSRRPSTRAAQPLSLSHAPFRFPLSVRLLALCPTPLAGSIHFSQRCNPACTLRPKLRHQLSRLRPLSSSPRTRPPAQLYRHHGSTVASLHRDSCV